MKIRLWVASLLGLLHFGCAEGDPPIVLSEPRFGVATADFEIRLSSGYVPGSLHLALQGEAQELPRDVVVGEAILVSLEIDGEPVRLTVSADFENDTGHRTFRITRVLSPPRGSPSLLGSDPSPEQSIGVDDWVVLQFAGSVGSGFSDTVRLICGGHAILVRIDTLASGRVVINPGRRLPPRSTCRLRWRGQDGSEQLVFRVRPKVGRARIHYEPTNPSSVSPYPDDARTTMASDSPTGLRVDVPVPDRSGIQEIFGALLQEVNGLDGFSPIAPIVFAVDAPVDASSLPATPEQSLDPLSSVALVDVTEGSARYGQRVPFRLEVRNEPGVERHAVLIFPSIPLSAGHQFGLLVTRRARALDGRPLAPSPYMTRVLGKRWARDAPDLVRARELVEPVLGVMETLHRPPIDRREVALGVRFTVRRFDHLSDDMSNIRRSIGSRPPPAFRIDRVERDADPTRPLALVVHGTWWAPNFREGRRFARDAAGRPRITGENEVPFTLALPRTATPGPVPVVFYQHGNPGTAEQEVPSPARDYLLEAGFAVVGFTDVLNREISARVGGSPRDEVTAQVLSLLVSIFLDRGIPDYWAQTTAEQLAFLRLIPELARVDWLPFDAADGIPELDPMLGLDYLGVSEGANHGPALLPYAPEVDAAVLVAGGARFGELLIHQDSEALLRALQLFFTGARPIDVWVGLALFQTALDRQDAHNHARYLYRDPIDLGGDGRRASVLIVEGLDDRLVPNHVTASLAWSMGPIPQLEPIGRVVPFLPRAKGPVRGNIDSETTAAFVQVVPTGVRDATATPGCVPPAIAERFAGEGHFCAQLSRESRAQRAKFLLSARDRAVPIVESIGVEEEGSR